MLSVYEEEFEVPVVARHEGLLPHLRAHVQAKLGGKALPVRLAVTETSASGYQCELGVVSGQSAAQLKQSHSIFDFQQRPSEDCESFNTVFVIPTGIGSELGGHAGDANAAAKLLAAVSDRLITHPNVVNASDLNELPPNGLYVEGSIIARLLMGTVGLQPVRANRVLVVLDSHADRYFSDMAINSVSAARASYGLSDARTVILDPPVRLEALYASSGRAVGRVERLEGLFRVLDELRGSYDALAITTQIEMPANYHKDYYVARGEMINPWGGVEAIFTHALSSLYDIPAAHAPMEASREVSNQELGIVDPRMAAEAISNAFFMCVLKGLQRAPRIIKDIRVSTPPGVLTAAHVSCLVIPLGCVGIPTLAALEQGIPVIAVRENRNIMKNDIEALPWRRGQLHVVENYWEAVGVMTALKAGVDPATVRRPLSETRFTLG